MGFRSHHGRQHSRFRVARSLSGRATPDLCSLQLQKNFTHGNRKGDEKVTFDQQKSTATRRNDGRRQIGFIGFHVRQGCVDVYAVRTQGTGAGQAACRSRGGFSARSTTFASNIQARSESKWAIRAGRGSHSGDNQRSHHGSDGRDFFRTRCRANSSAGSHSFIARLVHGGTGPVRIAFFSPLPPAKSGIADYSAVLLDHLKTFAEVEAFSLRARLRFDPSRTMPSSISSATIRITRLCTRWRWSIRASWCCMRRICII